MGRRFHCYIQVKIVFDIIQPIEFDEESLLVQLRNYPSISDNKNAECKQRNINSNTW